MKTYENFCSLDDRKIISLKGPDTIDFLQGLVSCDVKKVSETQAAYGAFLTPQGKFLFDFFITSFGDELLLDCEADRIEDFCRRLNLFKLRSNVEIRIIDELEVIALIGRDSLKLCELEEILGFTKQIDGGVLYSDPRHLDIGGRGVISKSFLVETMPKLIPETEKKNYHHLRISLGIPDGSNDIKVEQSTLLECGFEELNGVDFDKGCYMGQELTARTKYRGLIKKRLMPIEISGTPPELGSEIVQQGKTVGEIRSTISDKGIALIKLEALEKKEELLASGTVVKPLKPSWVNF